MNTLRICAGCAENKPYNPNAKRKSKASGFVSEYCWECHLKRCKVGPIPDYLERFAYLQQRWGSVFNKRGRPTHEAAVAVPRQMLPFDIWKDTRDNPYYNPTNKPPSTESAT